MKLLLEQCLLSVLKAGAGIELEVFVVDNASTDGSQDYFSNKFPEVRFFWNGHNEGFGKANNRVLHLTSGEVVLFLNPDTEVPATAFDACLNFMRSHSDCGALGVRMVDTKGLFLKESKRGIPTASASFFKMTGLHRLFPSSRTIAAYYAGHLPEKEVNPVEVLSGAFFMVTQKALAVVKGFDEDFFMYGEDIDLSIRIRQAGFVNYYFPEVTVLHHKGESTPKKTAFYTRHFYGAMALFVKKYYKKKPVLRASMLVAIRCSQLLADIKRKIS